MLPYRHSVNADGQVAIPILEWHGTAAGNSLGSSSARGSTGGDGRGNPRSHQRQAHGSSRRVCVGNTATRFRGDHLSALLNPVNTWETDGEKEGWARGTILLGKASGAPQEPANSFTRISETGAWGRGR